METDELLFMSTEQLTTPEKQNFDYDTLETETKFLVQQHTDQIKSLIRRTSQNIIDIGEKLIEVKKQLGHGKFINWLKFEFNWSVSTATRYIQVSQEFKFVNLTNLHIAASALYLLAAPSTPQKARAEALERASLGEVITHSCAQTIVNQYKKALKTKTPELAIFNDASKKEECMTCNFTTPLDVAKPIKFQSAAVVKPFPNKPLEEKTKAPEYSQINTQDHEMILSVNSSVYQPNNQSETEIQSLFKVGGHVCVIDGNLKNYKLFGKVTQIKKATASDIEVVITVSLQPVDDDKNVGDN